MAGKLKDLSLNPLTIRRYVEENFSIEKMVSSYLELYTEAVRHSSTRAA